MQPIHSLQNPKIKTIRALHDRKARQARGLYLVEGLFHLGEAFAAGAPAEFLCYAPDRLKSPFARELIQGWKSRNVPCYPTSAGVIDSLSDREGSGAMIGVFQQRWAGLDTLDPQNFPWGVALVEPQDPGNVGTILRTINAVGASGLLLLNGGVDPFHPTAVRASMGALFHHPPAQADTAGFADWLGRHGYRVYGSSAQAATDYRAVQSLQLPAILLLGSEREGLSRELQAACTEIVRLPMRGQVTSLNLAVAAGVLLYAMLDRLGENR